MNQSSYLHPEFIRRCLELARKGELNVTPNPQVGCVIVKNGRIVAEGYHRHFGGPHAEVEALRIAGERARGATLYVNLEPCTHFGKTPPCTETIIKAGVVKVIASMSDPNPRVAGEGFQKLRKAGLEVETGVLAREAEHLNERFVYFMKRREPFVAVKAAQTLDGMIADVKSRSTWITSSEARRESHRLRAMYEAVLIGAGTAMKDDPELTVRMVKGRQPIRIVLDGRLRSSPKLRVYDTRRARTIVVTSKSAIKRKRRAVNELERKGVAVMGIGMSAELPVAAVLSAFAKRGISSLLVEGGAATLAAFIEAERVNKMHIFVAPKILGAGLFAFSLKRARLLEKALTLERMDVKKVGEDLLVEGYVK
jgi:diaminohydroxyphosphoribosylaminopyrimidine deaminase/5-amino-6-(5-phosphoribosylamino)uracil reductase